MIAYRINGKSVTKEEWDARRGVGLDLSKREVPLGTVAYSESKPLISQSLGCLPRQVPEMRRVLKERGIRGARVLNDGAVELVSRSGRRELSALRGLHDNDGGYGDG
jgi:hypothetical protein